MRGVISDHVFYEACTGAGVNPYEFTEWEGVRETRLAERDEIQAKIRERREASHSYTHERQVKAEAEALIIVRDIREGTLSLKGQRFSDAYFVSNTRLIDDVSGHALPITMRPEAALQWLTTITPCSVEELPRLLQHFDN